MYVLSVKSFSKMKALFLLLFFAFYSTTWTLNILMYSPGIGSSHVHFLGRIADILIDGGHRVVG
jgi:hypothetical protein